MNNLEALLRFGHNASGSWEDGEGELPKPELAAELIQSYNDMQKIKSAFNLNDLLSFADGLEQLNRGFGRRLEDVLNEMSFESN